MTTEQQLLLIRILTRIGNLCPTCGSPVRVVSSDEGTNYYEPRPDAPGLDEALAVGESGIAEDADEAELYVRDLHAAGYRIARATAHRPDVAVGEWRITVAELLDIGHPALREGGRECQCAVHEDARKLLASPKGALL